MKENKNGSIQKIPFPRNSRLQKQRPEPNINSPKKEMIEFVSIYKRNGFRYYSILQMALKLLWISKKT